MSTPGPTPIPTPIPPVYVENPENQWFIVTIALNGVVHVWGPFANPYYARKQVTEFKRAERDAGRSPDDTRYVVCKALQPARDAVPESD